MLQLENAFLKCMGDSKDWHQTASISGAMLLDDLLPKFGGVDGAAICRMIAERLKGKGLVEIKYPDHMSMYWRVRRNSGRHHASKI